MATFVPRLAHTNIPWKEKSCKESLIGTDGPDGLEIIFALLTEVVAIHVRFFIVHIWYFSLEGSLALRWRPTRSWVQLQVGPHELFEQFIRRGRSQSGNWSENQRGNQFETRGRVTKRSGRGTTWMRASNGARVPGKLIFHKVNKKEVSTGGTPRAEISKSHFGGWLKIRSVNELDILLNGLADPLGMKLLEL